MTGAIPVLDLRRWDDPDERGGLADDLVAACHHVGFFSLVGHGVPAPFLDEYFAALTAFFALPESVKARIDKAQSRHFRGWERVGAELTGNRVDYREQLDLATENPSFPPDVEPAYLRLDGPNQWLPDDALPAFRPVVERFLAQMADLARRLMEVISVGLGLPAGHLQNVFGERPLSLAKLISYPPTPPGQAGVNSHHDAGFLTLLLQHGVGGLQALSPDGAWVDVPPRDDAFVVNLGEMLQAMTGNYAVAATHRVITTEPRYSSAYFHGPDLHTRLDPCRWTRASPKLSRRAPGTPAPGSWPGARSFLPGRPGRRPRPRRSTASSCGTTTCAATPTTCAATTPTRPSETGPRTTRRPPRPRSPGSAR